MGSQVRGATEPRIEVQVLLGTSPWRGISQAIPGDTELPGKEELPPMAGDSTKALPPKFPIPSEPVPLARRVLAAAALSRCRR